MSEATTTPTPTNTSSASVPRTDAEKFKDRMSKIDTLRKIIRSELRDFRDSFEGRIIGSNQETVAYCEIDWSDSDYENDTFVEDRMKPIRRFLTRGNAQLPLSQIGYVDRTDMAMEDHEILITISYRKIQEAPLPTTTTTTMSSSSSSSSSTSTSKDYRPFSLVVAATPSGGIGHKGRFPWPRLPSDVAFFRELTSTTTTNNNKAAVLMNAVIMGRKTWESIPENFRPLANRFNVVVTHSPTEELKGMTSRYDNVLTASSFDHAMRLVSRYLTSYVDSIFVIGGESVYKEALTLPQCHTIYFTHVFNEFPADTFMPSFDKEQYTITKQSEVYTEKDVKFQIVTYDKKKKQ